MKIGWLEEKIYKNESFWLPKVMTHKSLIHWWLIDESACSKLSNKLSFVKMQAIQAKLWAVFDYSEEEKKEEEEA